MALVRRLGRQLSFLWLGSNDQPSPRQAHALSERRVCQGCANCKGADWLLKTQIVAHLWTIFCEWPDMSCYMSTWVHYAGVDITTKLGTVLLSLDHAHFGE